MILQENRKQDSFLRERQIRIIKVLEYKRNGPTIYNVILKLDNDSYIKIMTAQNA